MSREKKVTDIITAKDKFCEQIGLPATVTEGLCYLEMLGNREVILDGCKGIAEYADDKIKLNLCRNTISFSGEDLRIKSLNGEQAIICGNIISVEFG